MQNVILVMYAEANTSCLILLKYHWSVMLSELMHIHLPCEVQCLPQRSSILYFTFLPHVCEHWEAHWQRCHFPSQSTLTAATSATLFLTLRNEDLAEVIFCACRYHLNKCTPIELITGLQGNYVYLFKHQNGVYAECSRAAKAQLNCGVSGDGLYSCKYKKKQTNYKFSSFFAVFIVFKIKITPVLVFWLTLSPRRFWGLFL